MEYDEWIDGLFNWEPFDHDRCEEWDRKVNSLSPNKTLDLIVKTFTRAGVDLQPFSDERVALGLELITGVGEDALRRIYDADVTTSERLADINSVYILFRDCLALRCSDCSEKTAGHLDTYAYMFWDDSFLCINNIVHARVDDKEELIEAVLDVLERTLTIPNATCQQAAIHGLGHARDSIKDYCQKGKRRTNWLKRIDEILRRYCLSTTDEPLKAYAYQARTETIM